jgi:hypothetical protein
VVLSSCVHTPFKHKSLIECVARDCPTEDELEEYEKYFKEEYPDDLVGTLALKWNPQGAYITQYGYSLQDKVVATHGRFWIECNSIGGWVHERIHLYYWWRDNRPMYHPGGIWPDFTDNMKETRLKKRLRERFNRW